MGQTKRRRKRKHRGTPAGTIEARGRTSRPSPNCKAPQAGKLTAAERRAQRLAQPPTWRSAFNRSLIAAALFGFVVILFFGQTVPGGIALAGVMLLIYWPMTYYMDLFMHRRFKRRMEQRRRR